MNVGNKIAEIRVSKSVIYTVALAAIVHGGLRPRDLRIRAV
jgi:hypothetical protein